VISPCPYLSHEPSIVFSLPCPAEEGNERAALAGTWTPATVNPPHLFMRYVAWFRITLSLAGVGRTVGEENLEM